MNLVVVVSQQRVCSAHAEVIPPTTEDSSSGISLLRTRGGDPVPVDGVVVKD